MRRPRSRFGKSSCTSTCNASARYIIVRRPCALVAPSASDRMGICFDAVGFVIDRTDKRELGVVNAENLGQSNFAEVVWEQVSGSRAAVDDEQTGWLGGMKYRVQTALVLKTDERGLGVKAFQRRLLVIGIGTAVRDAVVFEVLDQVDGHEALADAEFAADDEVDLFAHWKVVDGFGG
jgi:hypothetical protein